MKIKGKQKKPAPGVENVLDHLALSNKVGDELELLIADNELRLSASKTRLARALQRLHRFIKPGRSLSKELIAERREAALRE